MGIFFDFLGSIFGYVLWFFFDAVSNYAVAIVLFTLLINLLMLPLIIKQRKSMIANAGMAEKEAELKKKYEKDPKKYNEELARLYEREGFNPASGCLSMLLPMLLWIGIIGAINRPLQNTLHISREKISEAVKVLPSLEETGIKVTRGYEELQIVRHYSELKDRLTMFNDEERADIEEYSSGFDLMGINLLKRPSDCNFNEFSWIIPVLYFISSVLMTYVSQKMMQTQQMTQGCLKFQPYLLSLFTFYISYTAPGAMGLYWMLNSVVGMVQNLILNKFYNVYTIGAKNQAARFARLQIEEAKVVSEKSID